MDKRKLEYIALDDLKAYERNTRTHSEEQIEQLKNSITEFGFTNPILIDEDNVIIAGHGRSVAARELGMKEVPCLRLTGLSEVQRKALRIADNQLALNAGWDEELLRMELEDIRLEDFNLDVIGFSLDEVEMYLGENRNGNHIQELLENDMTDKMKQCNTFAVSFNFDLKHKDEILDYIKKKGKEYFSNIITEGALKCR